MANFRGRSQFAYSYVAKKVSLHVKVLFGATGAPTIVSGTGMGIKSITRLSAGRYSIALPAAYGSLLGVRNTSISAAAPAAPSLFVAVDNSGLASAPAITVQFNAAGTATDPASGEVSALEIILSDSNLAY